MARTTQGAALTVRHRQAQIQVRAQTLRDFAHLWPIWQGDEKSFGLLVAAALPLVRAHRQISASLAAAYFEAFRKAEKVPLTASPVLANPAVDEQVVASLYVTGRVMTGKALAAGAQPEQAMREALVRTSGAVGRHVLAGGRETVIRSTASDRQAQGWVRVTDGKPCAFCAMLAGRGPIYSEDTADFRAHDHCACGAEPSYEGSVWPGRAREYHDMYQRAVKDARRSGDLQRGTSNDLLNAFRRAYTAA